jgi:carboxyl-terminal processing protease
VDETKNSTKQVVQPLVLSLAVSIGILIGLSISKYQEPGSKVKVNTERFEEVLNYVDAQYVDTVDTELLTEHAIKEMLEKLDPHTIYIPKREVEFAQASLQSDFDGIGVEFDIIRDTLFVLNPIDGGPSKKAGIKPGDRIVKVGERDIAGVGIKTSAVFDLLRGERGTTVALGIMREGVSGVTTYKVKRDQIPVYSVEVGMMLDEQVGFIKMSRFARNTYNEFKTALTKLKKKGMKRLIIDLRDNSGGYLDQATKIIDELLPKGSLIVYTQGKEDQNNKRYIAERNGLFEQLPIIVLINENSASASEILAGALQDNDRALVVGRRSYGKGFVQNPIELSDGSELRLTVSRFYTPSGRCIQKPYTDDVDEYSKEYLKRIENGELFVQDSIKMNDSLKFQTLKMRRTVYGGGGIAPDQFVPKDTSEYSALIGRMYGLNTLREYAILYYNAHESELKDWTMKGFASTFEVTDDMLIELVSLAERTDIHVDPFQLERSTPLMKLHIKSYLARQVWGNEGYFLVQNSRDDFVSKSFDSMKMAEKLSKAAVE